MSDTICGALRETALLATMQERHWREMGELTGCPASRFRDQHGNAVYASVYFVEVTTGDEGLGAFGPDDELAVSGALSRYGSSMLDGVHHLAAVGDQSGALTVKISFVLVAGDEGPDALRVSTPANAALGRIPGLAVEPISYRAIRTAQADGGFFVAPPEARRLWDGAFEFAAAIDPDRDLNGVGLLYFANYVTFLDASERAALVEAGFAPVALDGRITRRRQIGYYGNATPRDRLLVDVEAYALNGPPMTRFLVNHRVRRQSDGRLIAIASAERALRPGPS